MTEVYKWSSEGLVREHQRIGEGGVGCSMSKVQGNKWHDIFKGQERGLHDLMNTGCPGHKMCSEPGERGGPGCTGSHRLETEIRL